MARRSAFTRITALAAASLLALGAVTAVSAPASAALPVPEQDPFYSVPAGIAAHADGAILKSRQVSASAYSLPFAGDRLAGPVDIGL